MSLESDKKHEKLIQLALETGTGKREIQEALGGYEMFKRKLKTIKMKIRIESWYDNQQYEIGELDSTTTSFFAIAEIEEDEYSKIKKIINDYNEVQDRLSSLYHKYSKD